MRYPTELVWRFLKAIPLGKGRTLVHPNVKHIFLAQLTVIALRCCVYNMHETAESVKREETEMK